jgi:putative ABC transport system substrate-binding protein
MRRRDFAAMLAGAAIASRESSGAQQQKAMPVIGVLSILPCQSPEVLQDSPLVAAFRQGLNTTGYSEGQNVVFDYRWAEGRLDRLPALAADLVGHNVAVIVTDGGTASALAAKAATAAIPIVFMNVTDPVGDGLIASLAHPGGNLTGFSNVASELTAKRLELLSEFVPQARVMALLVNPKNPVTEVLIQGMESAARARGVQLSIVNASTDNEIDAAFLSLIDQKCNALVVSADSFFYIRREQLLALAARDAIPTIYGAREFAFGGGLMSYGTSLPSIFRLAGEYAGRILNGEKPADLPVQQPTKFELVINLKTAQALGLTVPQSLLARADEVIE